MPTQKPVIQSRLYDFIDILRDANVNISTDEVLALFNALPYISLNDGTGFKQALQTTLIKDYTDIPVFNQSFNAFFLSVKGKTGDDFERMANSMARKNESEKKGILADDEMAMLEKGIEEFIDALDDKLLFKGSPEQILNLFVEELQGNDSSGGLGMMLFKTQRGKSRSQGHGDSEEGGQIDEELKNLLFQLFSQKLLKKKIGTEIKKREDYLLNKLIYQLKPQEIKEMRELIKRFGQKLKNRISLRKKRVKHGGIDIKRTLRTSLQYGAVPFKIFFKDRKIDRPQLVVLCDISGSVNQYTRFMLLLTYTLQSLFSKVRTFAFISTLVEITPLFMEMDPEKAINSIFHDTDFTYGWGTNYGRCFNQFYEEHSDALNRKTTVLILGDARNNHQDPGLDSFIKIKERSRNIFWLNPEKKHLWDWSDSIATLYQKYCLEMKEVNNFLDLSEFIDKLFPGYHS